MTNQCMLTTHDNPYDPFDNFRQWFLFDIEKHYDSCSRLNRVLETVLDKKNKKLEELSDEELKKETENAIDEIIKIDLTDTYIKVSKNLYGTDTNRQ